MQVLDQQPGDDLESEIVARPLTILATAAIAGVGAELALHTSLVNSEPPGLGIPVAVAVAVAGLLYGAARLGRSADRSTLAMYLVAIGFAALTAVRASSPLIAINVISSLALLSLAATAHNPSAIRPTFVSEFARTAMKSLGHTWLGGFLVAGRDLRSIELTSAERLRRVATGFLIALPMLLVFGILFASADQVFGDAIGRLIDLQFPEGFIAGLAIAALFAWGVLGVLRGIVTEPALTDEREDRSSLGTTEASTAMWLVNGLFAIFVAFQVFEAAASYQVADVSYAQQARDGFFQLVTVAAAVVLVVLALDWMVSSTNGPRLHRQQFVLIGLTGAVLISALVRMGLYVDAYGLTRLRVFTTAFMLWIAFLLIWLTRTVLAGNRRSFARPAVAALLVAVAVLNSANPDGLIASYNLDHEPRLAAGVDRTYLYHSLSPDAVPAIVASIDSLGNPCEQLRVIEQIEVHYSDDVRNWNLSRSRALGLIERMQNELDGACQSG